MSASYACRKRYWFSIPFISVRLSVTLWYYIETNGQVFPQSGTGITLISLSATAVTELEGNSLSRDVKYTGVGENLRFSTEIAVGNGTR